MTDEQRETVEGIDAEDGIAGLDPPSGDIAFVTDDGKRGTISPGGGIEYDDLPLAR